MQNKTTRQLEEWYKMPTEELIAVYKNIINKILSDIDPDYAKMSDNQAVRNANYRGYLNIDLELVYYVLCKRGASDF